MNEPLLSCYHFLPPRIDSNIIISIVVIIVLGKVNECLLIETVSSIGQLTSWSTLSFNEKPIVIILLHLISFCDETKKSLMIMFSLQLV